MFVPHSKTVAPLDPCGQPEHEDCGLRLVLDRLGEKWTVMTIAELASGPRRYRQLQRALHGVTQRMLTLTLQRLERDGFVSRTVEPTIPPAVTYALTERGQGFAEQVAGLVDWSRANRQVIEQSRQDYDRRRAASPRPYIVVPE